MTDVHQNDHQTDTHTITGKAVGSLKWAALMEVVSRTAQPIIFVILARLLTPNDFGVVATAMIAISFSQMFWDAGLSKALIQTREAPEDAAHVVFWTNVVLGLLVYLLLFCAAPAIALFFNSPASGPVLRVLGIQIIIASLTSVQQALFVRDLDFRALFWIKLFTAFIPGIFSIPLALYGYGVWALVAGSLAGQAINLYLLWKKSAWRPQFRYDVVLARSLFSFGFWVLLESFGAWLIIWGDNLIVGRFLGVHDLGVYRTGWMLVTIIFGLFLNPFLPVLYPTFSRLQDDLPALKNTFNRVNSIVIALALPMGIGLWLIGPELATVLFGSKWEGLGLVLSILALTLGLAWSVGINTEVYRAMGRPDINTKLMLVTVLLYIPAYYIAAQFSLEIFLYVRLSLVFVGIAIQAYLCHRMLNISPFYLWHHGGKCLPAVMAMAIGVAVLKWGILRMIIPISNVPLSLGVLICSGCMIYLGCLWWTDRPFILNTITILKKALT